MNILVTGANGYLARNLITSFSSRHTIFELTRENNNKEFIKQSNPDVIIHTICSYGRNNESIFNIYESNLITGMQLLETAKEIEKNVTFINCGSSLEKYTNLYSISKTHLVELGKFLSNDKLQFINMNLEHFYGAGATNNFISFVINECKKNQTIPLTEGTQRRDFIYIDDVCNAFNAVIKNKHTLDNFVSIDVGTGVSISVKEVVEKIKILMNSTSKLDFGKIPLRNNDPQEMKANISKLTSMRWRPQTSISQGLELVRDFYNGK